MNTPTDSSPPEPTTLLWVDDNDPHSVLYPLTSLFQAAGLTVVHAQTYVSGIEMLDSLAADEIERTTLLTDPLLPYRLSSGALSSELGVKLARIAAERGVPRIVLLSVCLKDEIDRCIESLQKTTRGATIKSHRKATLLMPNEFDQLLQKIRS